MHRFLTLKKSTTSNRVNFLSMPRYPETAIRSADTRIIHVQPPTGVSALTAYNRVKIRAVTAIFPFFVPVRKGWKNNARKTADRQICTADSIV